MAKLMRREPPADAGGSRQSVGTPRARRRLTTRETLRVDPSITQNNGPTGSCLRSFSHGRSAPHAPQGTHLSGRSTDRRGDRGGHAPGRGGPPRAACWCADRGAVAGCAAHPSSDSNQGRSRSDRAPPSAAAFLSARSSRSFLILGGATRPAPAMLVPPFTRERSRVAGVESETAKVLRR
jgi:hypothetical protein